MKRLKTTMQAMVALSPGCLEAVRLQLESSDHLLPPPRRAACGCTTTSCLAKGAAAMTLRFNSLATPANRRLGPLYPPQPSRVESQRLEPHPPKKLEEARK